MGSGTSAAGAGAADSEAADSGAADSGAADSGAPAVRLVRWLRTGWLRPGWLVPLQGAAMLGHLLPGGPGVRPAPSVRVVGAVGLVTGAAVATAAAFELGGELTPAVEPRPGSSLRTGGLYALSRNPLYAGLLVASAGTLLLRGRLTTLLAAAGLGVVLHVKAREEEQALVARFGEQYEAYRDRVPRLLGLPRA